MALVAARGSGSLLCRDRPPPARKRPPSSRSTGTSTTSPTEGAPSNSSTRPRGSFSLHFGHLAALARLDGEVVGVEGDWGIASTRARRGDLCAVEDTPRSSANGGDGEAAEALEHQGDKVGAPVSSPRLCNADDNHGMNRSVSCPQICWLLDNDAVGVQGANISRRGYICFLTHRPQRYITLCCIIG